MNSGSKSSSKEEQAICQSQSVESSSMSFSDDQKNPKQSVDSDEVGFEDLYETVNQIINFIRTKDFSCILSRFKNLETYSKRFSKERNEHPRFYIRCLVELEDCIHEVWDNRKILAKKNRQHLDTVKRKLQKISKFSAYGMAKYRENRDLSDEDKEEEEYESETENDINANACMNSDNSTFENDECIEDDPLETKKSILPYNRNVRRFGKQILKIDSTQLTYEEAYNNPEYIKRALDLQDSSNTDIPITFTEFVLHKMAVGSVICTNFEEALDPRAREYLLKLIGPQDSESRQVHPENRNQRPSLFRGLFIKLFSRKVITNLQQINCEVEKYNKLARVFPFVIDKNVPKYEIHLLNKFDDHFYDRMQRFLDQHFDKKVPVRETTELFFNSAHHFFTTMFSTEQQSTEYLGTFPRLNDKGIVHFQYLYTEYRCVLRYIYNWKRRVPCLNFEDEDLRMLPEKNINEIASLLDPDVFCTKPELYNDIFRKYLFFFVHTLQVEEDQTPVFFIDDMIYQCMLSLQAFRTLRQDIKMIFDIAMITLIGLLGHKAEINNTYCNSNSVDWYSINSATLRNSKEYITKFVSDKNNVQFNYEYKTDLICEIPIRVNNKICFDVCYATKKYNCQRGIMYFLRQFICSVSSPDNDPIECIVCYSAYLGQENRFKIPRNIVESVRNFVRLSCRKNVSKVSLRPIRNEYSNLLRDRLITSQK